jgi:hypothetical protein
MVWFGGINRPVEPEESKMTSRVAVEDLFWMATMTLRSGRTLGPRTEAKEVVIVMSEWDIFRRAGVEKAV